MCIFANNLSILNVNKNILMCAYTSIFYKLYKHTHKIYLSVKLALERSRGNGHFLLMILRGGDTGN